MENTLNQSNTAGQVAAGDSPAASLVSLSTSQFTNEITDRHSGASMDISFWTPDYENTSSPIDPSFFFLGFYASGSNDYYNKNNSQLLFKAVNDDPQNPCFKAPINFYCIWSKSHCDMQVYSMVAPSGYVAVGCVATNDGNAPSAANVANFQQLMCVREDFCLQINVDNSNEVWNDHGSGAELNGSVYLLPTSLTAWGVGNYFQPQTTMDIRPLS